MNSEYRYVEHTDDSDWSEDYDMLVGPNGFECLLTEPEDRRWIRDGKRVVAELNKLQARITALETAARAVVDGWNAARDNAWNNCDEMRWSQLLQEYEKFEALEKILDNPTCKQVEPGVD